MSKTYLDIVSGKICILQVEITEEVYSQYYSFGQQRNKVACGKI